MSGIECVVAGVRDSERVIALLETMRQEAGTVLSSGERSVIARVIADPSFGKVILARQDDHDVGLAGVFFRHSLSAQGVVAVLEGLYVAPDLRRKGIGRELLVTALDACRVSGARKCTVAANLSLLATVKLFASEGFRKLSWAPLELDL